MLSYISLLSYVSQRVRVEPLACCARQADIRMRHKRNPRFSIFYLNLLRHLSCCLTSPTSLPAAALCCVCGRVRLVAEFIYLILNQPSNSLIGPVPLLGNEGKWTITLVFVGECPRVYVCICTVCVCVRAYLHLRAAKTLTEGVSLRRCWEPAYRHDVALKQLTWHRGRG